jgi:hypothetical protein
MDQPIIDEIDKMDSDEARQEKLVTPVDAFLFCFGPDRKENDNDNDR